MEKHSAVSNVERGMSEETWRWNVGEGTEEQRNLALIYCAMDHPNPVTRHVCREILARKLTEKSSEDIRPNRR